MSLMGDPQKRRQWQSWALVIGGVVLVFIVLSATGILN